MVGMILSDSSSSRQQFTLLKHAKQTVASTYDSHASVTSDIVITGFDSRVALGTRGGVLRGLLSLNLSAASVMYFSHLQCRHARLPIKQAAIHVV